MTFELIIIAALVLWLISKMGRSPTSRGRKGELRVTSAFTRALDNHTYYDLHDVMLPVPDGTTQIDHILVSRYGVFVVETKNYSGWIFGSEKNRTWTQTFRRKRFKFQNPLRQNFKHCRAVQSALGIPRHWIHSVVIFAGDAEFKTPMPRNVCSLRKGIKYIKRFNEQIIPDEQVARLAERLEAAVLPSAQISHGDHIANLKSLRKDPRCPKCGADMKLRIARKGQGVGKRFWGCSRFPRCRATKILA